MMIRKLNTIIMLFNRLGGLQNVNSYLTLEYERRESSFLFVEE